MLPWSRSARAWVRWCTGTGRSPVCVVSGLTCGWLTSGGRRSSSSSSRGRGHSSSSSGRSGPHPSSGSVSTTGASASAGRGPPHLPLLLPPMPRGRLLLLPLARGGAGLLLSSRLPLRQRRLATGAGEGARSGHQDSSSSSSGSRVLLLAMRLPHPGLTLCPHSPLLPRPGRHQPHLEGTHHPLLAPAEPPRELAAVNQAAPSAACSTTSTAPPLAGLQARQIGRSCSGLLMS